MHRFNDSKVFIGDLPADKHAKNTAEAADHKLAEKFETKLCADPPADPAADGYSDPDK